MPSRGEGKNTSSWGDPLCSQAEVHRDLVAQPRPFPATSIPFQNLVCHCRTQLALIASHIITCDNKQGIHPELPHLLSSSTGPALTCYCASGFLLLDPPPSMLYRRHTA